MRVHQIQPAPPFNALAARRLRQSLGMAPGHVAYGMYASYGLTHITADTIEAWERGQAAPNATELTALAGALWCAPAELMGAATTLREHRLARGLAPEDVAHAVGVGVDAYLRMEKTGKWRGNERQAKALAETLGLSVREFATVTGLDERLTEMLRGTVTTRWQAYTRPIAKLLPLERSRLDAALERLHEDYQALMVGTLSWGGGSASGEAAGREFLERVLDHFWARVEPADPGHLGGPGPRHRA
ncbi:helix-turn-helix domain-containing protein [Streptomyces sp. O3]